VATEITALRASGGRLELDLEIGGADREVTFEVDADLEPGTDAAVCAALVPAMTQPGPLRVPEPVDATLLERLPELQGIFSAWSDEWPNPAGPLRTIDVLAEPATRRTRPGRGVGAFFSGGVDSFATALARSDVTHLVTIIGFDFAPDAHRVREAVRERLSEASRRLGKAWMCVETDARALSDDFVAWVAYYGSLLASCAHLLAPMLSKMYVASESSYHSFFRRSSSPTIDHLWGTRALEVVHDGARFRRIEKLIQIAAEPIVQEALRVCWENRGGEYNCCRCEKCLRTMVALEALGQLDGFPAFPAALDLEAVAAVRADAPSERVYWLENLELARDRGASRSMIAAIEAALSKRERSPEDARRAELEAEVAALRSALDGVTNSSSWKLTAPLRRAKRALRR